MKRKSTAFLWLLCLLLLAAIPAAAAGESRQPLQLCLSSASAPAGGEAELTLSLENNPGVAAIFADLSYDGSVLEYLGCEGNIPFGVWELDAVAADGSFGWYAPENYCEDGAILTLRFRVKDGAVWRQGGYPVTVSFASEGAVSHGAARWDAERNTAEPLECRAVNGCVEVLCTPQGHRWDAVSYCWSADRTACSARRICLNDTAHAESAEAAVSVITEEADCENAGCVRFTASFAEDWAEEQSYALILPPLEHAWVFERTDRSDLPYTNLYTCAHDASHTREERVETPRAEAVVLSCAAEETVCVRSDASFTVTAAVLPANGEQDVVWSGMKEEYASFSVSGSTLTVSSFTGKTGTLTLTATAADGSRVKSSVRLKLVRRADTLEIADNRGKPLESYTLRGGSSYAFRALLRAPDGPVTDKAVVWELSSSEYASVDANGRVKVTPFAGEPVNVELRARLRENGEVCNLLPLTLLSNLSAGVNILRDGERVNGDTLTADIRSDSLQLTAALVGLSGEVVWKSSSAKIASVDQTGLVRFLAPGSVTLTAACGKNTAKLKLTVKRYTESITVKNIPEQLLSGRSVSLKAVTEPLRPTDRTLLWSLAPGDEAYALLKNGKLTARRSLNAPVTVTVQLRSRDGYAETAFPVQLVPGAEKVVITGAPTGSTEVGACVRLSAAVQPMSAGQDVVWSSSSRYYRVDENGCIVPTADAKGGTVTFTATARDGSRKKASVRIRFVRRMVDEDLRLPETAVLGAGKTLTLRPEVNQAVTDRTLRCSMEPSPYAVLSGSRLTAAKEIAEPVTVKVTATARDGSGIAKSCYVTLYPLTTAVNLYAEGEKVTGRSIGFEDGLRLHIVSEPAGCASVWTVQSSSSAVSAAVEGDVLTACSLRSLKPGTRITLTVTAADGSGRSAKVTLKVQ